MQNFWSSSWDTVYIRALDRRLAAKITPITKLQLAQIYGWQANANDYSDNTSTPSEAFVFTDCENNLMFVANLQREPPGVIQIYDRFGNLEAHSLSDPVVARHQFVDGNGYLIAAAESPGLFLNVSRPEPPANGSRADVLPYALKFSKGGYDNASRLMDDDYRWVLAAAVQIRAVSDAYGYWHPRTWPILLATFWSLGALYVLGICYAVSCIFKMVYPPRVFVGKHFAGPFMYSEKQALLSQSQSQARRGGNIAGPRYI